MTKSHDKMFGRKPQAGPTPCEIFLGNHSRFNCIDNNILNEGLVFLTFNYECPNNLNVRRKVKTKEKTKLEIEDEIKKTNHSEYRCIVKNISTYIVECQIGYNFSNCCIFSSSFELVVKMFLTVLIVLSICSL
jgi:hypothetical protein